MTALLASEDGNFYRRSGIFAERFVDGPEFTVFVIADRNAPGGARAYPPVQRLFHSALPSDERFLSYDRYWSEYKEEPRLPEGEPFYRYGLAPGRLRDRLADLAVRAFLALDGIGYGRVDIRLEERTDQLFVLEVNANCGLSGDRETSVGESRRHADLRSPALIREFGLRLSAL
jgi:D-alanine-D-alanine ligase